MNQKGLSFKGFLKSYFEQYKYTTVTTELFRDELSIEAGMDLTAEFDQYIYGKASMSPEKKGIVEEDEFHPHLSKAQLEKLTMP
jgi:aminopeptidase N